jgi:type III secretion protein Q
MINKPTFQKRDKKMSPVTKHRFQTVDANHIHLLNRLYQCKRRLPFRLGNERYSAHLLFNNQSIDTAMHIAICIDNRLDYHISVDQAFIRNAFGDFCSIGELQHLPEFLKATALEIAAEKLLDRFDQYYDCHSVIVESHAESNVIKDQCSITFELLHENKNTRFKGKITTNAEGLAWLLGKWEKLPKIFEKKIDYVPLTATFELGYALLNISEIKSVEVNDIILLDDRLSPGKSLINLNISDTIILNGRIDASGNIIIDKNMLKGAKQDMKQKDNKQMLSADSLLENMPVKLAFKVGEAQITCAELMDLQPGYTFETDNCLEKPVEIDANGQSLGMGELVNIGERLGVRVLEIESN